MPKNKTAVSKTYRRSKICTERCWIYLDHPDLRETPCLVSFHILLGHFPIQIIIRDRPNTFLVFLARVKNADISDDVLMNVPKHSCFPCLKIPFC